MATIQKTLSVKAIKFKAKRATPKDWQTINIDVLIKSIYENCQTLADRHHPVTYDINVGSACMFLNKIKEIPNSGVIFDVCSYTSGHVPESMVPQLNSREADITPVLIQDENGNKGELVHNYRCLAFGQILIIEYVSGGRGSIGLQDLLNRLIAKVFGTAHPKIEFNDIGSANLRDLISARGGVSKITAKIVETSKVGGSTYGQTLYSVRSTVPHSASCIVTWEHGDETLGVDESIQMLEESDNDSLSSVTIHFAKGGSISDLSSYRERKRVSIQITPDGRPAVTEIETELKKYLNLLRDPQKNGPIYTDGKLKNVKLIGE